MNNLLIAVAGILGLVIGSFTNVIVLRMQTGRSALGGRSKCTSCGETLGWSELIPLVSYIFQLGYCKHCHSRISPQYALAEAITSIVFMFVTWRYLSGYILPDTELILFFYLVAFTLLIALSLYDVRHKIIPNAFVYSFIMVAFVIHLARSEALNIGFFGIDFFVGLIVASFFATLWLVSKGRWMGLGDAKLVVGIGFLLGFPETLDALAIGFWIGALVGIGSLLVRRSSFTMKSEIPLGPFLVAGVVIIFVTGISFLRIA